MWKNIFLVINLLVISGRCDNSLNESKPDLTSATQAVPSVSPDATPTSTIITNEELLGEKPGFVAKPEIPSMQIELNENPQKPNRLVTFDQRQEGQYNIRADLENFMIVVIPPNPSAGVNLLDLLTRSSLKRSSASTKSNLRKHNIMDQKHPFGLVKNSPGQHNINFLNRIPQQYPSITSVSSLDSQKEYIEGRTPYRVDISSNDGDLANKIYQQTPTADGQIDVIPPPYPQHYQQLIKPYHLEIEPVVHHLPPVQSQSVPHFPALQQANIVDFLNRATNRRFAKSVHDTGGNKVLTSNQLDNFDTNRFDNKREIEYYPYYMGVNNDAFYPPLSTADNINLDKYSKEIEDDFEVNGNNWELKLLGASEQCGPDGIRDSYGVCQFIKSI